MERSERRVVLRRHTLKDLETKGITPEGKEIALQFREKLKTEGTDIFVIVSSSKPRGRRTAEVIRGEIPVINFRNVGVGEDAFSAAVADSIVVQKLLIDDRAAGAGHVELSETEKRALESKNDPLGSTGAIFKSSEYKERLEMAGDSLLSLVNDIMKVLPDGKLALLIVHSYAALAAEQKLKGEPLDKIQRIYGPLEGYDIVEVDGQLKIVPPKMKPSDEQAEHSPIGSRRMNVLTAE